MGTKRTKDKTLKFWSMTMIAYYLFWRLHFKPFGEIRYKKTYKVKKCDSSYFFPTWHLEKSDCFVLPQKTAFCPFKPTRGIFYLFLNPDIGWASGFLMSSDRKVKSGFPAPLFLSGRWLSKGGPFVCPQFTVIKAMSLSNCPTDPLTILEAKKA